MWLNGTSQFSEETSVNIKVEGIAQDGEGTKWFGESFQNSWK